MLGLENKNRVEEMQQIKFTRASHALATEQCVWGASRDLVAGRSLVVAVGHAKTSRGRIGMNGVAGQESDSQASSGSSGSSWVLRLQNAILADLSETEGSQPSQPGSDRDRAVEDSEGTDLESALLSPFLRFQDSGGTPFNPGIPR